MKPPIVLLTDYGYQDPYAGILHGVIASHAPASRVIDLTHGIEPQNVRQASFYLEDAFPFFSKGSIFVCVVDPGVGTERSILCVKSNSHYFLAPDNGLLTGILRKNASAEIRKLPSVKFLNRKISATFHGRDLFAPVAASLAKKPAIFKMLGPRVQDYVRLPLSAVRKSKNSVEGKVIYFDHFGNAVTDIRREDAAAGFWNSAQISAGSKRIGCIVKTYGLGRKPVVLWNSADRLEIAVPGGKASSFLKIRTVIKVQSEK